MCVSHCTQQHQCSHLHRLMRLLAVISLLLVPFDAELRISTGMGVDEVEKKKSHKVTECMVEVEVVTGKLEAVMRAT